MTYPYNAALSSSVLCALALGALTVLGACDKKADAPASTTTANDTTTNAAALTTKEAAPAEEVKELVVYCGRKEKMLKPLFERYTKEKGVKLTVQYGKSNALAATVMEEGDKTPADLFFAQDVSTLGFLEKEGKLAKLPKELVVRVPEKFRSNDSKWVGTSGRARVLVYNTEKVQEADLPKDIDALLDPKWKGRIGWAPENASFKSFVAALIAERGEKETLKWLKAVQGMEPKAYPSNTPMVTAAGEGEILVGLTNHYYLFRLKAENGDSFAANNHYFRSGKAGSLVNAAGVGVLATSKKQEAAQAFISWVLSKDSQEYFAQQTHEFPMAADVAASKKLPAIKSLGLPKTDLGKLGDLEPTERLLREAGALK